MRGPMITRHASQGPQHRQEGGNRLIHCLLDGRAPLKPYLHPVVRLAYISTTFLGKYEGLAMGPFSISWEPHTTLYGMLMPENSRNSGHVNDGRLTGMLKEQMRIKDIEARRRAIFDIQRYVAEQQYYIYLYCTGITGSWQPHVKNYAPNPTFDYGSRAAALWLDR